MVNKQILSVNELEAGVKMLADRMGKVINPGIFTGKTVNMTIEEAAKRPIPRQLWHELWFENELCILYADTNLGKSIYAVMVADKISQDEKVVFFDFELTDKQFQIRYSDENGNSHHFSDNLYRFEINSDGDFSDDIETQINDSMKSVIEMTGAKVIIVDNLTYLCVETEKAKSALPLMKSLKNLKNKYGLSILCLAHTPKRNLSNPITRNDLAGSKTLINFCDSAFAIGESARDKSIRYVKQIKSRNSEIKYDSGNVILYQIIKENGNFLKFDFIDYGSEREHLKETSEKDKKALEVNVIELHRQGKTLREIGLEVGISHMTVGRILKHKSNV